MKVSRDILNLVPYAPGKPIDEAKREFGLTQVYKLASNENAIGPSPMAVAAAIKALGDINRYPDPSCFELVKDLSALCGNPVEAIACGNGSNELIDLLIRVFCEPGERILVSENSFVAYPICARAAHVEVKTFSTTKDLKYDAQSIVDYLKSSVEKKDRILFIANPNNPTGTYLTLVEVEQILEASKDIPDFLVVLDEAYVEFVRATDFPKSFELLKRYSHLVIIRTMAKAYGLAGLRFGYMVADPEITQYIHRVRNPFNVNNIVQEAVRAAMRDYDYMRRSQECVWQGLDYFYKELSRLGLPYIPSQANFVLFDTRSNAQEVSDKLLRQGIILRPLKGYNLPQYLRMSVGLPEENRAAILALENVLTNK